MRYAVVAFEKLPFGRHGSRAELSIDLTVHGPNLAFEFVACRQFVDKTFSTLPKLKATRPGCSSKLPGIRDSSIGLMVSAGCVTKIRSICPFHVGLRIVVTGEPPNRTSSPT
ncbi:MAG: hypothetical protein JO333_20505 [Verrucomicrobia bacterium]|nr:hypothetical protein [Verrucomicrobiota bacterium]